MISRTLTVKLIISICFLFLLSVSTVEARNEYLNNYESRCGEVDVRIETEDRGTNYAYSDSDYDSNNHRLSLTYRKYLGSDCKTTKENLLLRQQLELMKMCNKVNRNPSLAYNNNFDLLVSKCRGVVPQIDETETMPTGSLWEDLKEDYLDDNPGAKTLDNTKLKIPPKDYKLPLPKND